MYIVTVSPILRGPHLEELSYFSSKKYPSGALITIPVRKKTERPALVLESKEASKNKTELKGASYALRKIPEQKVHFVAHSSFIKSVEDLAVDSALPLGPTLLEVLPRASFSYSIKEKEYKSKFTGNSKYKALQNTQELRGEYYKKIIRESFAKGESVFILSPTKTQIDKIQKHVSKGINAHSFVMHGSLTQKVQEKRWKDAMEHSHPILLISTPQYMSMPRPDLSTIILEEESSPHWKSMSRPFPNFRKLASLYAERRCLKIVYADIIIRSETFKGILSGKIEKEERFMDSYPSVKNRVLDMHKFNKEESFSFFAEPIENVLSSLGSKKEKAIVYVVRKGLYPLTQCGDCGTIVKCKKCSYPLVLYRKEGRNIYKCHTCNKDYASDIRCHSCHGWKLSLLGIGIESIALHLKEKYPETPLFVLGNEKGQKNKEIKQIYADFKDSETGILLCTEKGLAAETLSADYSIAVSLDPLFSIPDLRINEKIARIVLTLRSYTTNTIFLQTRNGSLEMLDMLAGGKCEKFLEYELSLRKTFKLPPYTRLIKLSWIQDENIKNRIEEKFKEEKPEIYKSFYRSKKGGVIINALISLEAKDFPKKKLYKKLQYLPYEITVEVDPESLM